MKIGIVGTGYVGLITGTCFAEMGIDVICVDTDIKKIENLNRGIIPIYEPGLEDMIKRNTAGGRLSFYTDLASQLDNLDIVFSAVGTPPDEDGNADMQYVKEVAHTVGKNMSKYILLVTKSTVPVGSAQIIKDIISEELAQRGVDIPFDVASNPEFLKEGAAIKDFMSPDRVVVGVDNNRARLLMEKLYKPFTLNNYRIIFMDIPSAEMTKYAANAMLATRISFMNDIANLCEKVGADVDMVRRGIGSDARIGSKFLYPGCGYGGSCFPKDIKALCKTGVQNGYHLNVLEAVDEVNETQKAIVFDKLNALLDNNLKGKIIAVWGLSFKPETDDMREAPSRIIINKLLEAGASVKAYDPVAMKEAKRIFGDRITFCNDMYSATIDADALALITEWKQFRIPDWTLVRQNMRGNVIVDGRNIYDYKDIIAEGFFYSGIGRCFNK
ncbi:MAG: UDP-glucose/GDP-mannose dehydrogenase family protein [Bacteroidales bacterium]|nr:UDP-glucose/GDP-mannose dehydrogenase family protein [Bacteroidales bacterium]